MQTINIEFTADEINVTLTLLDIAVKAAGLQVAQNAAVIGIKLGVAQQALLPKPNGAAVAPNGVDAPEPPAA